MIKITELMIKILKKKAKETPCRTKVSALGFNYKGELVAKSSNQPRFIRSGGGIHAEELLFRKAKRKGIKTIIICRINKNGGLLPIDPCIKCQGIAEKLGIKILSVTKGKE